MVNADIALNTTSMLELVVPYKNKPTINATTELNIKSISEIYVQNNSLPR